MRTSSFFRWWNLLRSSTQDYEVPDKKRARFVIVCGALEGQRDTLEEWQGGHRR